MPNLQAAQQDPDNGMAVPSKSHIETLYEIAIAIGNDAPLDELLQHSLSTLLHKLDCSVGGIYLVTSQDTGYYHVELAEAIPEHPTKDPAFTEGLLKIPGGQGVIELHSFVGRLPIIGQAASGDHYHIFNLPPNALLILVKKGASIPQEVVSGLVPLMVKLGGAINARQQHTNLQRTVSSLRMAEQQLQKYRNHLEELVDQRTQELSNLNRKLRDEITKHQRTTDSFRESEERYRGVLQGSLDPIVVYDNLGYVLYLNPAFTRVFGWSLDELLGRQIDFVPESEKSETARLFAAAQSGEDINNYETVRLTRSGERIQVSLNAAIWHNRADEVAGMIVNIKDITEQKRLETQLRHAQKMQAVDTLAGGVAHEFNNILQSISGCVHFLKNSPNVGDKESTFVSVIDKSSRRAAELVKQLLTASRKYESRQISVSLNEEVVRTLELAQQIVPRMVEIEHVLAPDLTTVTADPAQVEQILLNLISNAIAAMPQGGTLRFETRRQFLDANQVKHMVGMAPGDHVVLSITDSGCGIDPAIIEHIFEPFFTTKDIGKGTGLGLSTVYGIMRSHHGFISCHSEVGVGTTFELYFPATDGEAVFEEVQSGSGWDMGGTETVMVVDDELQVRNIARQMLESQGYTVLEAQSGEEAIEIASAQGKNLDIVILDLGMPGMGGEKCLEKLKSIHPEIQVIVATGYATDEQAERVKSLGASSFLNKPYRMKNLLFEIRRVVFNAS